MWDGAQRGVFLIFKRAHTHTHPAIYFADAVAANSLRAHCYARAPSFLLSYFFEALRFSFRSLPFANDDDETVLFPVYRKVSSRLWMRKSDC